MNNHEKPQNNAENEPKIEFKVNEFGERQLRIGKRTFTKFNKELHDAVFDPEKIPMEDIKEHIAPYLKKITPEVAQKIMTVLNKSDFTNDIEKACNLFLGELSNILELEEKPSFQLNRKRSDGINGEYDHDLLMTRLYGNTTTYNILRIVAHEAWHSRQSFLSESKARNDDDAKWQILYQYNFKKYNDGEKDYEGYTKQLVEREAECFGVAVADRILKMTRPKTKTYDSLGF